MRMEFNKPAMQEVPEVVHNGQLALDLTVRELLLAASPATIDRLLALIRSPAGRRKPRKSVSKSGRRVPIRTIADWNEPMPVIQAVFGGYRGP
jgi:hypothetical protein